MADNISRDMLTQKKKDLIPSFFPAYSFQMSVSGIGTSLPQTQVLAAPPHK
jgi:hypothetical protein